MSPQILSTFLFAALALTTSPVFAKSVPIEGWLRRAGVRLLAVEFYATWCQPCMAAMPKWKDLQAKHGREGLRIIVVATQDPKACADRSRIPFQPDAFICDSDGSIAELFSANPLPAAYLWSWQGNLLAKKKSADQVENAINAWMRSTQRVDVAVSELAEGSGISKRTLANMVRGRLRQDDKITIVASAEERRKLQEIKAKSFESRFDASLQCQVGKDLSANSLLEVFITGAGSSKRLQLTLLSAERGCLVGSETVEWHRGKAEVSVAEAVSGLMQKVRRQTQLPWVRAATSKVGFGSGLGSAQAVPTVAAFDAQVPTGSFSALDVNFLKRLQTAKRTERRAGATAGEKADAWGQVARYKGKNPLRQEAAKRRDAWAKVAEAEKKRKAQLTQVKQQYSEDRKKLRELLALDDDILSPKQKRAIQAEFDRAYAKWKDELEQETTTVATAGATTLHLRARPNRCINTKDVFGWVTTTNKQGSKITTVHGDPARKLGIQLGDVIKRVDGVAVTRCEQYTNAALAVWEGKAQQATFEVQKKRGGWLKLLVARKGKSKSKSKTYQPSRSRDLVMRTKPQASCVNIEKVFGWNTTTNKSGSRVIKVSGPPASSLGIQIGDVLKRIDGRAITKCEHYAKAALDVWNGKRSSARLEIKKESGVMNTLQVVARGAGRTGISTSLRMKVRPKPGCENLVQVFGWVTQTNKKGSKLITVSGSQAKAIGLVVGDVIERVDGRLITDCKHYVTPAIDVWNRKRSEITLEIKKKNGGRQSLRIHR